ncbi:UPF0280 family protein [Psychromarinibacter sp. C21-152]|uniref:UPF0280 family protein n=1 Tax=Psychromarinibacter sediminicola TaxID=3033385 RepID=A0AAE3T7S1_9RHOB|nr:UPF0280 family protein [Psychromarinibacter sediminicola]MDF0599319.1 UPF0280 family protein [Psychromarinibacter sediminicola]
MERAAARLLPDGRLHLQHGPIDIVAGAEGPGRAAALRRAAVRFERVLEELVAELPLLRAPVSEGHAVSGPVARRMQAATVAFLPAFVTPMAAVAGAVADEIVSVMASDGVVKAYANNGGDVAFHLGAGASATAAVAAPVPARVRLDHAGPVRGVATSGWRGRSHSLGIADSVTVLAPTAAQADAAATLIANAVDLPGHRGIRRMPARELLPDSDLGARRVTVEVPLLSPAEAAEALARGRARAEAFVEAGHVVAAFLVLQGQTAQAGRMGLEAPVSAAD